MGLSIERTHLDGLVMFLAVAELRGFRAASRQLGVTPSAVSQAIHSLEERVGAPLFSRTTRSVGLTQAGERLFAHAKARRGHAHGGPGRGQRLRWPD